MAKIYLLRETKTIAEFDNLDEIKAEKDNNELWYPENCYEILEQEIIRKCEVCNKEKKDVRFEGSEEKFICDKCLYEIKKQEI